MRARVTMVSLGLFASLAALACSSTTIRNDPGDGGTGSSSSSSTCGDRVFAYNQALYTCKLVPTAPLQSDSDQSCARSDSAWPSCLTEVDALKECLGTTCDVNDGACCTALSNLDGCLGTARPTCGSGSSSGSSGGSSSGSSGSSGTTGWGSATTCSQGADVFEECCVLSGASCNPKSTVVSCCETSTCASGKAIACLANYTGNSVDACNTALNTCDP